MPRGGEKHTGYSTPGVPTADGRSGWAVTARRAVSEGGDVRAAREGDRCAMNERDSKTARGRAEGSVVWGGSCPVGHQRRGKEKMGRGGEGGKHTKYTAGPQHSTREGMKWVGGRDSGIYSQR
jgi:hypothetical protein